MYIFLFCPESGEYMSPSHVCKKNINFRLKRNNTNNNQFISTFRLSHAFIVLQSHNLATLPIFSAPRGNNAY